MKKNGKYCNSKKGLNMKPLAVLLALTLLVGCAIGGTLAWLTAQTGPVQNTFTTSDITITLDESENLNLKMIPGHTITKDPWARVEAGSEDCYLFVEVTKSENFDDFMTYAIDSNWTELQAGVYYMVVDADNERNVQHAILEDNQVAVEESVDKAMMDGLKANGATQPSLTFKAYAVQLWKSNKPADLTDTDAVAAAQFTAAEAWAQRPTT